MKHSETLSTYTPVEFKDLARQILKQYRKDNPEMNYKLDSPYPWFLRVANDSTVLVLQIKDKNNWTRDHTIRL